MAQFVFQGVNFILELSLELLSHTFGDYKPAASWLLASVGPARRHVALETTCWQPVLAPATVQKMGDQVARSQEPVARSEQTPIASFVCLRTQIRRSSRREGQNCLSGALGVNCTYSCSFLSCSGAH
jgi:hypothetical protein